MDGIIREILNRTRSLRFGRVKETHKTTDAVEVVIDLLPTGEEIIATQTSPCGGSGGGFIRTPKKGDVALIAITDGDYTNSLIIGYLMDKLSSLSIDEVSNGFHIIAPTDEIIEIINKKSKLRFESNEDIKCHAEGVYEVTTSKDATVDATGSIELRSKKDATVDATGSIELRSKKGASVATTGEIKIGNKAGGHVKIKTTGGVVIGNNAADLIDEILNINIQLMTLVSALTTAGGSGQPWPVTGPILSGALGPIASQLGLVTNKLIALKM